VIPLLHDFADERVLVVGGGSVGARRVEAVADGVLAERDDASR
jgi:siroheme synthase (precorrin-2 oxidase/ferrochelatase)